MIAVRRATPDDIEAIARVHDRSRRETYDPIFGAAAMHPGLDEQRAKWRLALAGPGVVHVAIDGSTVVGFAHALNGTLTTLYILASHQRRGLGRALLAAIAHDMRARGHDDLRFNVLAKNSNAIAFYEAQGARRLGRVVLDEHGHRYEDELFILPTNL